MISSVIFFQIGHLNLNFLMSCRQTASFKIWISKGQDLFCILNFHPCNPTYIEGRAGARFLVRIPVASSLAWLYAGICCLSKLVRDISNQLSDFRPLPGYSTLWPWPKFTVNFGHKLSHIKQKAFACTVSYELIDELSWMVPLKTQWLSR